MRTVAGMLVGGASRRMGRDKALLPAGGVTLIERTVGVARAVADEVVMAGEPPFELPAALRDVTIIADFLPGIGPLGGLHSLLAARPGCAILLLACDMPQLTAELLRRLTPGAGDDAVVFVTPGEPERRHPCCGLYLPTAAGMVAEQVAAGRHAMMALLERLRVRYVRVDAAEAAMLRNVNRAGD